MQYMRFTSERSEVKPTNCRDKCARQPNQLPVHWRRVCTGTHRSPVPPFGSHSCAACAPSPVAAPPPPPSVENSQSRNENSMNHDKWRASDERKDQQLNFCFAFVVTLQCTKLIVVENRTKTLYPISNVHRISSYIFYFILFFMFFFPCSSSLSSLFRRSRLSFSPVECNLFAEIYSPRRSALAIEQV